METTVINATEHRNVSLSLLSESKTNPRRIFEDAALKELSESIRTQGVLSPLLVRPLTENGFEIVAGARRYRAAQMAEAETVPVRIVNMNDAQALEAQLVENLIRAGTSAPDGWKRRDSRRLHSTWKSQPTRLSRRSPRRPENNPPSYAASRLKLIDLVPAAVIDSALHRG